MNGKYQKLAQIGLGPQSAVFRARQLDLNREVALKELRGEWQANAGSRERFFREADRWAALASDHLARIHDVDRDRGWVILELFAASLSQQVQRGPADAALVRNALEQALEGLIYLHGRGYLHGNIKPTNLLCDERQRVRLADGRCLAAADHGELPAPAPPYKYVAPELVNEEAGAIGPPSDLYCLGFVGLELLAGPRFTSLFRGVDSDAGAGSGWMRFHASLGDRAPDPRTLATNLDESLARTLEGMLRKRVAERWRDAGEALAELRRAAPPPPPPAAAGQPQAFAPARPGAATSAAAAPPGGAALHASAPRRPGTAPQAGAATTLVERPDFPVVLRIVSGRRAGAMLGFAQDQVRLGSDTDCELQFAAEEEPAAENRRLSLRKELDGWRVYAERGSVWLNQTVLRGSAELRSGDILRLSTQGPDVQFVLHTPGTATLPSLAQKYGLAKAAAPTASAPSRPSPTAGAAPATESSRTAPVPPAAGMRPLPPGQGSGEKGDPAPANAAAPRGPGGGAPPPVPASFWLGDPPAPAPQPRGAAKSWTDFSKWDKNTKNWVTLGLGLIVVIVVAALWPTGSAESPAPPAEKRPPAANGASGEKPATANEESGENGPSRPPEIEKKTRETNSAGEVAP